MAPAPHPQLKENTVKSKTLGLLLLTIALGLIMSIAFTGCAGLQTQHQKIGAACETVASGVEAATAAKQAGRISKAQLQKVVDVAATTTKFCEPAPAESLTASDYATLLGAAATVAASPGASP
jgi:uncharacterized protein HemX